MMRPAAYILDDLRKWHRRRLCDRDIAAELGPGWYRERVAYWRGVLNLPSNGYNRRNRVDERCMYAARCGWGHLMPGVEYIEVQGRKKRLKLDLAGFDLTNRQVDILSALRDKGPQTRAELALPRHYRSFDNCGRLLSLGLIERRLLRKGTRLVCLYGLTRAAGEHERERRPDAIERLIDRISDRK